MLTAKPNILYVDDEENNLVAFVAAFRRDFNIYTAHSGEEGLSILRKHPIQLIITDQRMPDMTGVQFLEAVMPDFPDPVRLILTGFHDVDAIIKAINAGRVYLYVTKPWNAGELRVSIDLALKEYELQQENKRLILKLNQEVIKQKKILHFFHKYVPDLVFNEIFSDIKDREAVDGEHRIISVLFADIRNFTDVVAKLYPRDSVNLLNAYFAHMSDCIARHNGSLNKFLGYGLLALFGAPVSYIDNQYNASFCAVDMLRVLEEFNTAWEHIIGVKLAIGIGINTGDVVSGNIGSKDHVEYSVIGDTVNVAFKIESLARNLPNAILISESTYQITQDRIVAEKMPLQVLPGMKAPIQLYRVEKCS